MRVRCRFTKLGKVRFLGHRDVARSWERAIRRAEIPIAYTEGFSPRPKVHFGLALSTGYESVAEYIDIDLRDDVDPSHLPERLSPVLPAGIDVTAAVAVADYADSLQSQVMSCSWSALFEGVGRQEVEAAVDRLMATTTLPLTITRKGKDLIEDVRPMVEKFTLGELSDTDAAHGRVAVDVVLACQPRSVRPSELFGTLGVPLIERRVCRDEQWMTIDGDRRPPVSLPVPSGAGAAGPA